MTLTPFHHSKAFFPRHNKVPFSQQLYLKPKSLDYDTITNVYASPLRTVNQKPWKIALLPFASNFLVAFMLNDSIAECFFINYLEQHQSSIKKSSWKSMPPYLASNYIFSEIFACRHNFTWCSSCFTKSHWKFLSLLWASS